ncbi:hypothetical protein AXX17_AT3G25000 [Arabidopsis thaliana]|uniref:Uncharacterized protein n=5 Tax=Arabidopsis TaxID=3701 RepID=A0A178VGB0_ARATH|nr:hypothetical protein AXX17_AT3G25000 [Arabidopsis thaliana]
MFGGLLPWSLRIATTRFDVITTPNFKHTPFWLQEMVEAEEPKLLPLSSQKSLLVKSRHIMVDENLERCQLLQAAGIRSYNGLVEQILKKPSCVIGLPMARLDQITEASQVILEKRAENYWKTRTSSKEKHSCNAIFVLKRIATLTTSIELNIAGRCSASQVQIDHWELEHLSCEIRAVNMERNNNF